MTDFWSIIVVFVAIGALQYTIILYLLFFGLGVRGFLTSALSIVIGVILCFGQLDNNAVKVTIGKPSAIEFNYDELIKSKINTDLTTESLTKSAFDQLTNGFKKGVFLLIPFLLVDVLVTHLLRILEISTISSSIISFPMKILLFLSVDGFNLVLNQLNVS